MTFYKFKKLPANFGQIKLNHSSGSLIPSDIYEYAKAFRNVYTRSAPILKAFADPDWAQHQEIKQLYGKAQSLAVQIAMSNELLLKAILLGSAGKFDKEHNLKKLVESLDIRYQDIIKKHLKDNGLNKGKWNKVINMSAQTFVDARYGFEGKDYVLDFRTLQQNSQTPRSRYKRTFQRCLVLLQNRIKNMSSKLSVGLESVFSVKPLSLLLKDSI